MAKATRGTQLVRADRAISGQVTFYDAREENAAAGRIGTLRLADIAPDADIPPAIAKAAIHGYTQNLLDSSNKLEGDDRVEFIRRGIETLRDGGWVSAPVDEDKAKANALAALEKMYQVTNDPAIMAMIQNLRG